MLDSIALIFILVAFVFAIYWDRRLSG